MTKDEGFLWHEVSEKEKEEIREQAKKIMDSFSNKLASVDKKIGKEAEFVERDKCERAEAEGKECDNGFRDIIFENAPKKDKTKGVIIAESKGW